MNENENFSKPFSDEEIIRRVLTDEKHLYENIMCKYNQRLYRISMSIIMDSEEAKDIVQSSYIKAYEHLSDFQFKSDFSTWLTRILINESFLHLHQKQRIPRIYKHGLKSLTCAMNHLYKHCSTKN
jgi:RNA polymerase sigma-70 factor (ECF subfamily)